MKRNRLLPAFLWALGAVLPVAAGDHAGNYSTATTGTDRWMTNGHRGGLNSAPWTFEGSSHGGFSGRFIGDSSLGGGDINSDGRAFALFANPPGDPNPFYAARKNFAKPALTTGDTISFQVAVNFRNGLKGFNLRNTADSSVWTFNVGRVVGNTGGYYIRNGPSQSTNWDDGQQFGGYHGNTVFTFTFTQRERVLEWTAERSGGIEATVSGSAPVESGTVATVRFFISGTDGGGLPENNLYFNNFTFETEPRGDAPLTLGERRLPGLVPSHILRFSDPLANSVTLRTSDDGFTQSHPLTQSDGVWEIDIRDLDLPPGWHNFKFRLNSQWETGANRRLYLRDDGKIALPPAVYLTWNGDPTTTMVVHWHNDSADDTHLVFRPHGGGPETAVEAESTVPFPYTERLVHTASLAGLNPDTEYEFNVDGYDETFRFRTLPATLDEPIRFGVGGDVDIGSTADAMTAAISSHDPAFLVVGGDVAYADGRAENFWKWMRYFESWFHNARAPDGRLIPKVMAIGNHEVRFGYAQFHPDFDNTADWRLRYAPYFYRFFAFPGDPGYGVLDFGSYLSLVVLDTDHSNLTVNQNTWLEETLDARRDRAHLIPIYHVPAYPSHRSFNDEFISRVRQHWVPLFEQAGVKLAFEHHDHTFKHTKPLLDGAEHPDGIVFVGDGLWGIGERPPDTSRWYLQPGASDRHHVHLVTLSADSRIVQTVGTDGTFFGGAEPGQILLAQPRDGIPETPANLAADHIRPRAARLVWEPVPNATTYEIERDGSVVATVSTAAWLDSDRTPETSASYRVTAINRSGRSAASAPLSIATPAETVPPFDLGTPGSGDGYLLASPGMTLYAALRGDDLYVATWAPDPGGNDHMILVATSLAESAIHPARWAKSGLTAHPPGMPYLAAESESMFHSWYDAPDTAATARGTGSGARLKGVLDLVDTFGALPPMIYLAAAAYETEDNGVLVAQAPAGNGDAHIDPEEFLALPIETIRDSTGIGVFDRLDPERGFRAQALDQGTNGGGFTVRWNAIPGRSYRLWRSTDLAEDSWQLVGPGPHTAPSGTSTLEHTDPDSAELPRAFYRVEVLTP